MMSDMNDISNNSGPGSAAEPSMEEILASIRRILKEDEGTQAKPDDGDDDDDAFDLDETMMIVPADISTATELPVAPPYIEPAPEAQPAAHFASEPAVEAGAFAPAPEPEPAPAPAPDHAILLEQTDMPPEIPIKPVLEHPALAEAPAETAEQEEMEDEMTQQDNVQAPEGLVSPDASAEITNTIGSLVRSISAERAISVSRGGITIEDIVREEIRPVLKAWLDTHLPTLVERIVRAEIGRVMDRTQA